MDGPAPPPGRGLRPTYGRSGSGAGPSAVARAPLDRVSAVALQFPRCFIDERCKKDGGGVTQLRFTQKGTKSSLRARNDVLVLQCVAAGGGRFSRTDVIRET